jgi:phosphatidylglycerophosphate synthase
MSSVNWEDEQKAKTATFTGREGGTILGKPEQRALFFFASHMPKWVTSDMLTIFGLFGSVIVLACFVLAAHVNRAWLFGTAVGLFIHWFGDATDGRVAYYRGTPRKWYGYTLDVMADWVSTAIMCFGFLLYFGYPTGVFGMVFMVFYAPGMLNMTIRYKVAEKYENSSGPMGPTEIRVCLVIMFVAEYFFPGIMRILGWVACATFLFFDIKDFHDILKSADARDKREKAEKAAQGGA